MDHSLLDIIPRPFRRRTCRVSLTIFARALLNFLGLALLLPVLVLILDTESIRTNRYLAAAYEWGGFADQRSFALAVCGTVVAVVVLKSLLGLALYKAERNYIYDLYAYMSHRLYVEYRNRGLTFIKGSNSAVLARNVNVVCLTFVTGILMPLATIASEATLFLLLFSGLALYNAAAAGLILVIFLPAAWSYYALVRNRLDRYGEIENRAHREKARTVIETFRGYPDIEINNAFPQMLRSFDRAMDDVVRTRSKQATIGLLPQMFTEVGLCAGMAVLVVASLGSEGGQMRLLFGVFAVAALRLMPSVRNVMSAWTSLKYNRYTIDILREAHTAGQELPNAEAERRTTDKLPFEHEIAVRNLSFRFEDGDRTLFEGLSLTIRKGERVGIRGASGAGKTTLFNLLLGLYTPTAGEITIDGTPLTPANRRAWQNRIGYVSQNLFLCDGTFAENVALGTPAAEIDRTRALEALEAARLGDFIASLPQGIDTPIGECGCRLSDRKSVV